MSLRKQQMPAGRSVPPKKIRTYQEIAAYLDARWSVPQDAAVFTKLKELDKALGSPSQHVSTLLVTGTNGKSITIGFTAKLLREEGLKVGTFTSPHVLHYKERISTATTTLAEKTFVERANEVINLAESLGIEAHAHQLLTMIALSHFAQEKVDVAVLEVGNGGRYDATQLCHALVAAITRIAPSELDGDSEDLHATIDEALSVVKQGTWLVSGDQIKANLEHMQQHTEKSLGNWAMPIRKVVALAYPFEQLHGRCAALAERLAQLFVEHYYAKTITITHDTLLNKKKTKRGRPTLEAKRHAELQPRKTLTQFWKDVLNDVPGRFHMLSKQKPAVLLDTASNLDAFKNLLLGIRLMHYNKPFKGLSMIIATPQGTLHSEEFLKTVRYFFKKTSGQVFICPLEMPQASLLEQSSWDVEKATNDIKSMKVKARACSSFEDALEAAQKAVDEKEGLICITGSRSIVTTYLRHKGIKKVS